MARNPAPLEVCIAQLKGGVFADAEERIKEMWDGCLSNLPAALRQSLPIE